MDRHPACDFQRTGPPLRVPVPPLTGSSPPKPSTPLGRILLYLLPTAVALPPCYPVSLPRQRASASSPPIMLLTSAHKAAPGPVIGCLSLILFTLFHWLFPPIDGFLRVPPLSYPVPLYRSSPQSVSLYNSCFTHPTLSQNSLLVPRAVVPRV